MFKTFPAYLYKGNVQVQPYNLSMDLNDDLIARYNQYTSETLLYHWQNVNITSVKKVINDYLGYELINNYRYLYIDRGNGAIPDYMYNVMNIMGCRFDIVSSDTSGDWTVKTLNNSVSGTGGTVGIFNFSSQLIAQGFTAYHCRLDYAAKYTNVYRQFIIEAIVLPEDIFDSETGIIQYDKDGLEFIIEGTFASGYEYVNEMTLTVRCAHTFTNNLVQYFTPKLNLNDSQATDHDPDNENGEYNDPNTGGDGDFGDPDSADPTEIPPLPSLGASDFVKMYTPSAATLTQLAQFLWSSDTVFNIDNFKKLYNDPSECLVGLSIVPCLPASAGTKHIMFGNIDTEVSCSYVNTQWVTVDCGWKYIEKLVNNFTDYSPYTKLQLFLPYIGFQHINIDEVAGFSIHVEYHVDIISGDLVCFIEHSKRGVIYSFSGNCLATVPVSGSSYGNFLGKYYSQLAQAPSAMISGAMQGGAAGAAMGGLNTLFNAAQTALLDRKATYSHSGAMSGAASIMGVQRPFVIIERPNLSVPDYIQNYAGRSANKTVSLGNCSGFTQVDYVHIDNVAATSEEIDEIERLLHEGVIL